MGLKNIGAFKEKMKRDTVLIVGGAAVVGVLIYFFGGSAPKVEEKKGSARWSGGSVRRRIPKMSGYSNFRRNP